MAAGKYTLSEQERNHLAERIRSIETSTSGELVVMIVQASDNYPGARWRLAVTFLVTSQFLLYYFLPSLEVLVLVVLQLPTLLLAYLLSAWRPLLRFFLAVDKVEEEVYQRATQEFFAQNVHETSHRSGIFIYLSLLERKAIILADTGINKQAPTGTWNTVLSDMLARLKTGSMADALGFAIDRCGAILKEKFPLRSEEEKSKTNELSNHIIVEE